MIGCLILAFALCNAQPAYAYPAYYPVAPQQQVYAPPVYYAAPQPVYQPYPVVYPAVQFPVVLRFGGGGHRYYR